METKYVRISYQHNQGKDVDVRIKCYDKDLENTYIELLFLYESVKGYKTTETLFRDAFDRKFGASTCVSDSETDSAFSDIENVQTEPIFGRKRKNSLFVEQKILCYDRAKECNIREKVSTRISRKRRYYKLVKTSIYSKFNRTHGTKSKTLKNKHALRKRRSKKSNLEKLPACAYQALNSEINVLLESYNSFPIHLVRDSHSKARLLSFFSNCFTVYDQFCKEVKPSLPSSREASEVSAKFSRWADFTKEFQRRCLSEEED